MNVPKNRDIRPTTDKIRGAVFNMLGSRNGVTDTHVLDAFCGSGALGLEALSRGATQCTFLDKARSSVDLAQENATMLNAQEDNIFRVQDTIKLPTRTQKQKAYTLVFLDPPYHQNMVQQSLDILETGDWLAPNALIVCEMERSTKLTPSKAFEILTEKTYGDIQIVLLHHKQEI